MKLRYFLVGEKIQRQSTFLKTRRPQPANFRKASIDVPGLEPHLEFASFEYAEAQEVLNVVLKSLAVGAHIAKHFALPFIQPAELLTLQQLHVPIEDG